MFAPAPAPDWTITEWSEPEVSFLTVSGVAATRVSPGRISVGMPIRITRFQYRSRRRTNHEGREEREGFNPSRPSRSSWCLGLRVLVGPGRERVAAFNRPAVESAAQPSHAVGGGSMGEALRTHLAARHALQPVVTNGGSRVQAFVRIAGFEQPARLCVMAPHAGMAVSLQLETNGQRIPLPVIPARLLRRDGFRDTQQVLHVVTNFV